MDLRIIAQVGTELRSVIQSPEQREKLFTQNSSPIYDYNRERINLLSTQISEHQVQLICKQLGDRVQNVHDEPE